MQKHLLLPIASILALGLSACSQITTSKDELAAMQSKAEQQGDAYVECIKSNSLRNSADSRIDVATAVKLAKDSCGTELAAYEKAEKEYLGAQVMMTEKPLNAAMEALDERATKEVGAALQAGGAAASVAPAAATKTPAAASTAPSVWNPEQRVYLDCMEDQAAKYSALNESAAVIADVAHSRCKSHAVAPGTAALIEEGRALVMGAVMDARLGAQGQ